MPVRPVIAKDHNATLSFRSSAVRSINEFFICVCIGQCGLPFCWDSRHSILHICYLLTLFSLFCTIFACLSIGTSQTLTKVGAWTTGEGDINDSIPTTVWVGLSGAVWQSQTGSVLADTYILWEDDACYNDADSDPYCDNCNSAGNTAVGMVLLAAVTRMPSIMLLKSRMLSHADEPLLKSLGYVSETLAAVCLASALFVWKEYCHKQLPLEDDLEYKHGQGFVLVALGFCLTFCMSIMHALMPTVDPDDHERFKKMGILSAERKAPQKPVKSHRVPAASGSRPMTGHRHSSGAKYSEAPRADKRYVDQGARTEKAIALRSNMDDVHLGADSGYDSRARPAERTKTHKTPGEKKKKKNRESGLKEGGRRESTHREGGRRESGHRDGGRRKSREPSV